MDISLILITAPNLQCAEEIAEILVKEKLAACVNIIQGVTSIYHWEGNMNKDSEVLLIVKAAKENYEALEKKVISVHPYSVPEIIEINVSRGFDKYISWVRSQSSL